MWHAHKRTFFFFFFFPPRRPFLVFSWDALTQDIDRWLWRLPGRDTVATLVLLESLSWVLCSVGGAPGWWPLASASCVIRFSMRKRRVPSLLPAQLAPSLPISCLRGTVVFCFPDFKFVPGGIWVPLLILPRLHSKLPGRALCSEVARSFPFPSSGCTSSPTRKMEVWRIPPGLQIGKCPFRWVMAVVCPWSSSRLYHFLDTLTDLLGCMSLVIIITVLNSSSLLIHGEFSLSSGCALIGRKIFLMGLEKDSWGFCWAVGDTATWLELQCFM